MPDQPRSTVARRAGVEEVASSELFFDLVFVFALSQITHTAVSNLTWAGIGRALLLFSLVWLIWAGFTWISNLPTKATGRRIRRAAAILAIALMLILGLSIPSAYGSLSWLFVGTYAALSILYAGLFLWSARHDRKLRRDVARMIAVQSLLLACLVAAAAVSVDPWSSALIILGVAAALLAPFVVDDDAWTVSPLHADERFALFILIAFGESLVAIGIGASEEPVVPAVITAMILAVVLVASLWWHYFELVAKSGASYLGSLPMAEQASKARLMYTYLHMVMVIGIVLVAIGLERSLDSLLEPIGAIPMLVLCSGISLFLLGIVGFRLAIEARIPRAATAVALVLPLIAPLLASTSPLLNLLVVTATVGALVPLLEAGRRRRA